MSKINVRVFRSAKEIIDFALDKGVMIDDWKDTSASECLEMGYGGFKIIGNSLKLSNEAADVVTLDSNPFDGATSGSVSVNFAETKCNADDWKWKRL